MPQTRHRGEQGDGAVVDDESGAVEGEESEDPRDPPVAATAEPFRRVGAVGHQRARLVGRTGRELYLIAMIDDATSRLFARFVRSDSTGENMKLLWSYLEKHGRPVAFYTDKASLFQTAGKRKRDEPGVDKDPVELPPTQIGRALQELGIAWIGAHSPQAKAYASYCTSCEPWKTFSGNRRLLASLTPCAFRGGWGPGSSYSQSSRSFTG
jgi:hypothetical protein